MDNVLITFTADTTELKPGVEGLKQLEIVDSQVADQAKRTADAIRQRDKSLSDGAKLNKKDIEGLATAMQNLDKSVVAGALKKTYAELRTQLKLTGDEAKKFYQNLIQNSRVEILKGGSSSQQLKELEATLQAASESLAELGHQQDTTGGKTQSFRARLRELKTELQQLENAGQENTVQFQHLSVEAAHLEDQIGDTSQRIRAMASDTFVFDALSSGVQGVTGAFAIGQGAVALFGSQNEKLQQALLKVNAAMSILQGLQALQNVLQKQSAVSIGVTLALQRLQTLQTRLQSAAESDYVIIRYGAIAAQRVLNAVMAANPAGVLLLAISAIAGALIYFTNNTKGAAEAQQKLNDEFEVGGKRLESYNKDLEDSTKVKIAEIKKGTSAIKQSYEQQQQTAEQIRQLEIEGVKKTLKSTVDYVNQYRSAFLQTARDLSDESLKLTKEEAEAKNKFIEDYKQKMRNEYELRTKLQLAEIDNEAETAKDRLELANRSTSALLEIEKRRAERVAEINKNIADNAPAEFYNIRIAALKRFESAQKISLELQKQQELSKAGLSADERRNIEDKYITDIDKLHEDSNLKRMELLQQYKISTFKTNKEIKADEERMLNELIAMNQQKNDISGQDHKSFIEGRIQFEEEGFKKTETIFKVGYETQLAILKESRAKGLITETEYQQKLKDLHYKYSTESIDREIASVRQQIAIADEGSKEKADLQLRLAELENQLGDENLAKFEAREARKKQMLQEGLDFISNLASIASSNNSANAQRELEEVKDLEDRKVITKEESAIREKAIKKRQADEEKKLALFQAAINMYAAISKAVASAPFPANLPAIFFASVTGLAQINAIASKQPQFKKGGYTGDKGTDQVAGIVHGQEFVAHATATKKYKPVLEAMNEDRFEEYMASIQLPKFPYQNISMPATPNDWQATVSNNLAIDYDKLGKSVADHVGNLRDVPGVDVQIDKSGIHVIAKKGADRTEFLNEKFNYKS